MGQSNIGALNESALQNLRSLVDVDTIIGDPINTADGTVIIPVSKVSFGFAAGGTDVGAQSHKEMFGGATGGGVTIQPIAFLTIKDGKVQLLQLAEQGNATERAINMVPDVVDKISAIFSKPKKTETDDKAEDDCIKF